MDLADLRELLASLQTTNVTELSLDTEGYKLAIKLAPHGHAVVTHAPAPMLQQAQPVAAPAAPVAQAAPVEAPAPIAASRPTLNAPMVGTFYRSPSPDAAPFVEVGDLIRQGQVICIIEAMKLMNELEAEAGGRIVRFLVESGQPVEYGQPLVELEPV